ncbi:MAG: hypothetical protein NTV51_03795 [Verrucomicrobia bacterium]|nr:hypothetical protein [Verrucomicrobiota bacterium]
MNARYTTLTTLLASLSLVITTGCAPGTEAVDEEDAQEESVQEIRGALGNGVVTPRQYVGPTDSCPAGWENAEAWGRANAWCFKLCPRGYHPDAYFLGVQFCQSNYTRDQNQSLSRPQQPLTCAPNLEYINGSCYRQCPAGSSSRGILGCEWGSQGQPAGGGA